MNDPIKALRMLLACIDNSSAVSYGQVDVLRSEDRENWAEAIECARAAVDGRVAPSGDCAFCGNAGFDGGCATCGRTPAATGGEP